jgi:hypothetical protein
VSISRSTLTAMGSYGSASHSCLIWDAATLVMKAFSQSHSHRGTFTSRQSVPGEPSSNRSKLSFACIQVDFGDFRFVRIRPTHVRLTRNTATFAMGASVSQHTPDEYAAAKPDPISPFEKPIMVRALSGRTGWSVSNASLYPGNIVPVTQKSLHWEASVALISLNMGVHDIRVYKIETPVHVKQNLGLCVQITKLTLLFGAFLNDKVNNELFG